MNLFFVCGAPKSGTTWLQRILDAHPEVCCSGEGHFITRFSAPVAQVVNGYNRDLGREARLIYDGQPYYGGVDQAEFDAVVRGFILNRLRARAGSETRWMGDKTPGYTGHLDQLHRLFPEAKIIHIVRDPRDVAVSWMAFAERAGRPGARTPGAEQHRLTLEGAVRTWTEAVTAVDAFHQRHPGLVHELDYADLHADPIGVTGRLSPSWARRPSRCCWSASSRRPRSRLCPAGVPARGIRSPSCARACRATGGPGWTRPAPNRSSKAAAR